MTLLLPFLLVAPALMLATAVVGLGRHGPAGWVAAAGLVVVVVRVTWAVGRRTSRWWRGTKAPVRPSAAAERVR